MNSSDGSTDGTLSRQLQADAFFTGERDEAAVASLKEERFLHDANADAFFASRWSTERLSRLLDEWGTPQVLLDRWRRDCERARVVDEEMWAAIRQREATERRRAAAERNARERARAAERSNEVPAICRGGGGDALLGRDAEEVVDEGEPAVVQGQNCSCRTGSPAPR